MGTVDLNADLGEEITHDDELLTLVTSANVACGYHAGGPAVMRRVCARAVARGVRVGAQVSYADRAGFGRVAQEVAPGVLAGQVADQVGTLTQIATSEGATVSYLKPHGALYHRVSDDPVQADAVLRGSPGLPVLGFPGAELLRLAAGYGRRTHTEGFADRGYTDGGRLRPRGEPGAVLASTEEVAAQALVLAERVDSVCVHGDTPDAVAHARAVHAALARAGRGPAAFGPGVSHAGSREA